MRQDVIKVSRAGVISEAEAVIGLPRIDWRYGPCVGRGSAVGGRDGQAAAALDDILWNVLSTVGRPIRLDIGDRVGVGAPEDLQDIETVVGQKTETGSCGSRLEQIERAFDLRTETRVLRVDRRLQRRSGQASGRQCAVGRCGQVL